MTEAIPGEENLLVNTVVEDQTQPAAASLTSVKIIPSLPASDNSGVRPEMTVE